MSYSTSYNDNIYALLNAFNNICKYVVKLSSIANLMPYVPVGIKQNKKNIGKLKLWLSKQSTNDHLDVDHNHNTIRYRNFRL